jgi:PPK2 family polyphosphate:nucleotide phosphotransferase
MASFKKYRIDGKFKLASIDPRATPFAKGSEEAQRQELDALALRLDELQNQLHAEGQRKLLLVLQGIDTSGKDGTIRWVFSRSSPLGIRVHAFKAPSEEERARDYLWRCHAVVPRAGEIGVWNRSHYEDVLVPVVERYIDKTETRRRYAQIRDFERLLAETGTVIVKCMLHISKDEQRKRLQTRIDEPEKRWKFSLGDLDVRKKWGNYEQAYENALHATSTDFAPWHVVPADNKLHRNLMVAHLLVKTLQNMAPAYPPASASIEGLVVQ